MNQFLEAVSVFLFFAVVIGIGLFLAYLLVLCIYTIVAGTLIRFISAASKAKADAYADAIRSLMGEEAERSRKKNQEAIDSIKAMILARTPQSSPTERQ